MAPLGQGGGPVLFENVAAAEMTLVIEVQLDSRTPTVPLSAGFSTSGVRIPILARFETLNSISHPTCRMVKSPALQRAKHCRMGVLWCPPPATPPRSREAMVNRTCCRCFRGANRTIGRPDHPERGPIIRFESPTWHRYTGAKITHHPAFVARPVRCGRLDCSGPA